MSLAGNIAGKIASLVAQAVLVVLVAFLVSMLVIQTYNINDVSMEPTFDRAGNRVLVYLFPFLLSVAPEHGDIVIVDSRVERPRSFADRLVENPLLSFVLGVENDHLWVKRVIGLPGDRLEFAGGKVYRNGQILEENYTSGEIGAVESPALVPEGHVYVLGDNRSRSNDSRQVGPIPFANIQGRVVVRFFPLDKIDIY